MHYDYNQKTQSYDFCENQLNVYIIYPKFSLIKKPPFEVSFYYIAI